MASHHVDTGNAHFKSGKYGEALRCYTAALGHDAADCRALSNRSACLMKLERFDEALADAEKAVAVDPSAKHHGRAAAALHALKRYIEAASHYEAAVAKDTTGNAGYAASLAEVRQLLASNRGTVGQSQRAAYSYERSLAKGKEAMAAEQYTEAARHFTKAIELCGSAKDKAVLYANRSAAHFRLCKYDAAAEDGRSSVADDAQYARGHVRLGMALAQLGDLESARTALERAVALDAANTAAAEELRKVAAQLEERRAANDATRAAEEFKTAAAAVEANRMKEAALQDGGAGVGSRPVAGGAKMHSTSYAYCKFCNEYGHLRNECPMRKKRPRE